MKDIAELFREWDWLSVALGLVHCGSGAKINDGFFINTGDVEVGFACGFDDGHDFSQVPETKGAAELVVCEGDLLCA